MICVAGVVTRLSSTNLVPESLFAPKNGLPGGLIRNAMISFVVASLTNSLGYLVPEMARPDGVWIWDAGLPIWSRAATTGSHLTPSTRR
jgi:hypothetical protein